MLLFLMSLQAIVCLIPAIHYPPGVRWALGPLQDMMLGLFRSQRSLQKFFYCTVGIHALEAVYVLAVIRRALRGHFGGCNALMWALQTFLVGFPSVILLMRRLADMEKTARQHQ